MKVIKILSKLNALIKVLGLDEPHGLLRHRSKNVMIVHTTHLN